MFFQFFSSKLLFAYPEINPFDQKNQYINALTHSLFNTNKKLNKKLDSYLNKHTIKLELEKFKPNNCVDYITLALKFGSLLFLNCIVSFYLIEKTYKSLCLVWA